MEGYMSERTMMENSVDGASDSSVINDLRKQVRDLTKKVANYEQARSDAAESMLTASGFGKLTDIYLSQVEGFPTDGSVADFLEGLGLKANEGETPDANDEEAMETEAEAPQGERPPVSASELGQQVATAATGGGEQDIMTLLNNAQSSEEIDRIMQDAGLSV